MRYECDELDNTTFNNISYLVESIISVCGHKDSLTINLSNRINEEFRDPRIIVEESISGYGAISKLLGHSVVSKNKRKYLLTELSFIKRDINSIALRVEKRNTCIIYLFNENDNENIFKIWFEDNGYKFFIISDVETLTNILEENKEKAIVIAYHINKERS